MDAHEQDQLARVLAGSDALATVHRHVKEFAEMLMLTRRRGGEDLEAGLADVQAHGALALRSIAAGSAGTTPP